MTGFYSTSRNYKDYKHGRKKRKWIKKLIFFIVLLFVIVNLISVLLLSSFRTVSQSMEPTLPVDSRFLATPLVYGSEIPLVNLKFPGFGKAERGDVVVLKPSYLEPDPGYLKFIDAFIRFFTVQRVTIQSSRKKEWENSLLVKRIIGIPGDEIIAEGFELRIKPDGKDRFYSEQSLLGDDVFLTYPDFPANWDFEHPFSGNLESFTLAEDEYLLLSDNRGKGSDGFTWGISTSSDIKRKVILRYWPTLTFRL